MCEVMVQQTQVARVAERWRPFLDRFPTPAALRGRRRSPRSSAGGPGSGTTAGRATCTAAPRRSWTTTAGACPDSLDALLALPGIGPYTARAVLAFAFERDHGVVDTNTARVLARWAGRRLRPREAQAAADASVPPGEAWAWNQAMLDLGASVCRRRDAALRRAARSPTRVAWAAAGCPAPDPADGSAGVSGGAVAASRAATARAGAAWSRPCAAARSPPPTLAAAMGWPDDPDRAARVAATLVADGLVRARRRAPTASPRT